MKLSELKRWVDSQLENGDNEVFISVDVSTSEKDFDHRIYAEPREKRISELEAQIEKLIDFVLSKTECCDVCPITDTCINSEGTCPYVGILAKGEEEVTREWIMQFISKEIKEK